MKKFLVISLIFVMAIGVLVSGSASSTPAATGKPIILGDLASYTGPSATSNNWMINGYKLAIHEVHGQVAGRPVRLINQDTGSTPSGSVDAARTLLQKNNADVLFGPISDDGFAAVNPLLIQTQQPHMAVVGDLSKDINGHPFVWAHDGTNESLGYEVGVYAYDVLGYRTATAIHDDVVFGKAFAQSAMDGFVSRGGKIVQEQASPLGTMDYSSYLTAMKHADCVFFWFVPASAMQFVTQFHAYGLKMPLIECGVNTLGLQDIAKLGAKAKGLVTIASYDAYVNNPKVKAFVKEWTTTYAHLSAEQGNFPDFDEGINCYISAKIALAALKATNGDTTPSVLNAAIGKLKVDTPWGQISFNDHGIGIGNRYILQVYNDNGTYKLKDVYTYHQILKAEPADAEGMGKVTP